MIEEEVVEKGNDGKYIVVDKELDKVVGSLFEGNDGKYL